MRLLAAALTLSLFASPALAQDESWDARVVSAKGEATVKPADGSADLDAGEDTPLQDGDRIVTGADGSVELSLDGTTLITINENTEFVVEATKKADASFLVKLGSILAKIQKLSGGGMKFRTPLAVAAVRGTDLGVEVEAEESWFGVFDEGKVEVKAAAAGTGDAADAAVPETLISNQETVVRRGARPAGAVQLKRFMRRRALMRGHARRLGAVRRHWKSLPPAERMKFRQQRFDIMRDRRKARLDRLKNQPIRRGGPDPEKQRRLQEIREKQRQAREKRIRQIRERGGR